MTQILHTLIVTDNVLMPLAWILKVLPNSVKLIAKLDVFAMQVMSWIILANVFFEIIVHVSMRNQCTTEWLMNEWNVPACPENETFTCNNAACEKNCGNLNESCKIVNFKCDNKCFCNDGFVRETPHGPCIPILKCPPNDCKINEVFECRNPTCDDEGCFMMGRPCQDVPCQYKCYCAPGLVRIGEKCLPKMNCFDMEDSAFNITSVVKI